MGLDLSPVGDYRGQVEASLNRHLHASVAKEEETLGDQQFFAWLDEYLAGSDKPCPVELQLYGSPFQLQVWNQLRKIPHGEVWTYAQVAAAIGTKGTRAVGTAVGRNPIPVVIPCHRVVRQDGTLGQFSAGDGPATKKVLLDIECAPVAHLV